MGALVETDAVLSAKRGLAYLRIALPSADARLKGLVSLADQAVVSAANFVTGVILARACAKEELGLYLLGLSLMLVALDIQTALLATPYMIHSPRLQAGALCRYSGATFVQQLILSGTFAAGLMVVSVILGLRGTG